MKGHAIVGFHRKINTNIHLKVRKPMIIKPWDFLNIIPEVNLLYPLEPDAYWKYDLSTLIIRCSIAGFYTKKVQVNYNK